MAAKRLQDGPDRDPEELEKSGPKKLRAVPSLSTVIKEAMMVKSMENLSGALEPLLRRVVQEELERILQRACLIQRKLIKSFNRSPQVQTEEVESINLRLAFKNPPALPIFTGSKIEDSDRNPLQILLIDTQNGSNSLAKLPMPLKLEPVVLDGEFSAEASWTSTEFDKAIIKERTGRRPLLTGEFPVVLRDGSASIGELNFTDNSSWVRSQLFRIGVRVVQEGYNGPKVREAVTEAFRVKDHRGEFYRKHYPPSLTDEVWRLERIGKDGAFHNRLSANNINTIHDFLKLLAVNPMQLRRILGVGMSDRMWEGTIGHARTCPTGDRLYAHHKQQYTVFLNTICEVMDVAIDGAPFPRQDLTRAQKAYVQEMVREAYENWERLEETNGNGILYNNVLQNQTIQESAIAPSPLYPGSDIPFEDFGEDEEVEATTTTIWGHICGDNFG